MFIINLWMRSTNSGLLDLRDQSFLLTTVLVHRFQQSFASDRFPMGYCHGLNLVSHIFLWKTLSIYSDSSNQFFFSGVDSSSMKMD